MSVELATAYVNIQASTKGLGKDITSTMGGAGTDGGQVAAKGFRQKFTGGLKGIGKVLAIFESSSTHFAQIGEL